MIKEDKKSAELIRPLLRGRDIKRYYYINSGLYLINIHNGIKEKNIAPINIKNYPSLKKRLDKYYKQLIKRQDKGDTPYNLRNCAYLEDFENYKIAWQRITDKNKFVFSEKGQYILDSMAFISGFSSINKAYYILSILNSELIYFWIKHNVHKYGDTGFRLSNQYVELIPIANADENTKNKLIKLVDTVIELKKQGQDTSVLEDEINNIVYSIYGLSEAEIRVVEGV